MVLGCLAPSAVTWAKVFLSTDEALALAFPGCRVERTTVYLTDAQRTRAEEAGSRLERSVVHPYRATCEEGAAGGTAYFDTHRVRTLAETIMVVVGSDGTVRRVEVLAFDEPEDYLPRSGWYRRFDGLALSRELEVGRGVPALTGATLTVRATTDAVRRALALHRALDADPVAPSADEASPP